MLTTTTTPAKFSPDAKNDDDSTSMFSMVVVHVLRAFLMLYHAWLLRHIVDYMMGKSSTAAVALALLNIALSHGDTIIIDSSQSASQSGKGESRV